MKKLFTKSNKLSLLAIATIAALTTLFACNQDDKSSPSPDATQATIENWPKTPKKVAQMMIEKYGEPQGVTSEMLIWNNNGPWKRTIVSRDTVQHNFPAPHPDLLEQVINYQVDPEKFDEMAMYDGSVILERTKGIMSARCDVEGANFLALNLADEVARGVKTKEEARGFYTQTMKTFKNTEQMNDYMKGFKFTVPSGGTTDPDVATF